VDSNLVMSMLLCNERGPYTGVPWTNDELTWSFESTSSSNCVAPSGVETDKTDAKRRYKTNIHTMCEQRWCYCAQNLSSCLQAGKSSQYITSHQVDSVFYPPSWDAKMSITFQAE